MNRGGLLALVGLAVLLFVAVPYAREFIQVDACLNGGGSYNYLAGTCDQSRTHPYSPYAQRHPRAASLALLGLGLTIAGIWTTRRAKRAH